MHSWCCAQTQNIGRIGKKNTQAEESRAWNASLVPRFPDREETGHVCYSAHRASEKGYHFGNLRSKGCQSPLAKRAICAISVTCVLYRHHTILGRFLAEFGTGSVHIDLSTDGRPELRRFETDRESRKNFSLKETFDFDDHWCIMSFKLQLAGDADSRTWRSI